MQKYDEYFRNTKIYINIYTLNHSSFTLFCLT